MTDIGDGARMLLIPPEVLAGVAEGLTYTFGPSPRSGEGPQWQAVPAEKAKPELTPLNAIRRLDAYYGENASEYINEALTVLWVHHMRESGLRK
jgi:hypothetical protein